MTDLFFLILFLKIRSADLTLIPVGFGEFSDDVVLLSKMLTILSPHKKWNVLEIGTGSGYSTALLSTMVNKILTIEL